jgi:hypothetical protein
MPSARMYCEIHELINPIKRIKILQKYLAGQMRIGKGAFQ